MSVTIAGTVFDRVSYDRDADVLYLHVGDPGDAVEFDESSEGHALRYGPNGRLVGITIVNARQLLARDGAITVTVPQPAWRVEASQLAGVLGLAS